MGRHNFPWEPLPSGTGYRWGSMVIRRTISDEKGGVWLTVHGKKKALEIRVSPAGEVLRYGERDVYEHELKDLP